jgi:O-antigen/teichoic acid export membrane protein
MANNTVRQFFGSAFLLLALNALVKPVWIFLIDRPAQLQLGAAPYGHYFSLLSFTLLFSILADAGLSVYYNRQLAATCNHSVYTFRYFLKLKLLLLAVYVAVVLLAAFIMGTPLSFLLLLLVLLQAALSLLVFLRSHITALQQYRNDAFLSVLDKLLVVLVAGACLWWWRPAFFTIEFFAGLQLVAVVVALIAAAFFVRRSLTVSTETAQNNIRGFSWRQALPYTVAVLLMTIVYRADGWLLYLLHPQNGVEAGNYAYGFRLLDAFNMAGYLLASFLLPFLSKHGFESRAGRTTTRQAAGLLLFFSVFVAAAVFLYRQPLFNFLYHQTHSGLSLTMALTMLALPGCALVHVYSTVLTAQGRIRLLAGVTAFFALLLVLLNVIFIPAHGARASACIAAGTQLGYGLALWIVNMKGEKKINIA